MSVRYFSKDLGMGLVREITLGPCGAISAHTLKQQTNSFKFFEYLMQNQAVDFISPHVHHSPIDSMNRNQTTEN